MTTRLAPAESAGRGAAPGRPGAPDGGLALLGWRGDPRPLRVSATAVAGQPGGCPAHRWAKVRPGVRPDVVDWQPRQLPWRSPIGVIVDAIVQAERGASVEDALPATGHRMVHPGVRRFAEHAVRRYLSVAAARQVALDVPLRLTDDRVLDPAGQELTYWGLSYDSPDRSVREVRRLRHGRARGADPDDRAWAAVAATVAAEGRRSGASAADPPPERVVVSEVGLLDGSHRVVFDGTPAAARACYRELAQPRLLPLLTGGPPRPGRDCAGCGWLAACPAVPVVPGLLGRPAPGPATGSVAAADLDRHARCPAQYYLSRVARLPDPAGPAEARLRGTAVHGWLAAAHARPGGPACVAADLPPPGTAPSPVAVADGAGYRDAWRYLRQHLANCPLAFDAVRSVRVEPTWYAYDPTADVLLAARPDLVFDTPAGQVWRETKTTAGQLPADATAARRGFLAAAVDLLFLAGPVAANTGRPGQLELEVLGPERSAVYAFDAADPEVVRAARSQLDEVLPGWLADVTFAPRPGPACGGCEVRAWCPSALAPGDGDGPDQPTGDRR